MGYRSEVRGEMTFSRPLTLSEAEKLKPVLNDEWSIWRLNVEETREIVEDGDTTIITRRWNAVGLELSYEDEVKCIGYDWDKVLQKIVNMLPEDVTVRGFYEAWGGGSWEDWKAERLYVIGREVTVHKAAMTWPPVPEGAQA